MSRIKGLIFFLFIVCYIPVFLFQESTYRNIGDRLKPLPPHQLVAALSGYAQELIAEIFFIRQAVYLGGVKAGTDHTSYAPTLAYNLEEIALLYPEFQDPYFYANGYLPHLGPEFAEMTNAILQIGRDALPDNLLLTFFQGTNYFQFLNNPNEAARVFSEGSAVPEASDIFAHLAAILSAQGGQLEAGIIMLHSMINGTDDPGVKRRYEQELAMFQDAVEVQRAVVAFHQKYGAYPRELTEVSPEFMAAIPSFGDSFTLLYNPPTVSLIRPHLVKTDK